MTNNPVPGSPVVHSGGAAAAAPRVDELMRTGVAEFIGMFAFCLFGCGSIAMTKLLGMDSGPGLIVVALAHGLTLALFIAATAKVSGGQINPAVSLALVLAGKQTPVKAAVAIVAQLAGACCGVGALAAVGSMDAEFGQALKDGAHGATLGMLSSGERASVPAVFLIETLMTFSLMFLVLRVAVNEASTTLAGISVGGTLALCILGLGPLTGASLNPGRSFGPAVYGHWDMHWVYWAAPILGACLAALVNRFVLEQRSAA